MAYRVEKVLWTKFYRTFKNIVLSYELIRNDELEENQVEIGVLVYKTLYHPHKSVLKNRMQETNFNPRESEEVLAKGKTRIAYAEVLRNNKTDDIFSALNADLVPEKQKQKQHWFLEEEVKKMISEILKTYKPQRLR